MKYVHLLVIALFLFSSCSEDSTSTTNSTNAKPYLEVRPESITVDQYEYFELDYRVANFPYESRVKILYNDENVDSSLETTYPSSMSYFYYTKPGNHTIKLSAYDSFADTLLATKSIPVTVAPFEPTISITPVDLDTTSDNILIYVPFSATSNLPDTFLREHHWFVRHNAGYEDFSSDRDPTFRFAASGTYTVSVSMIDYFSRVVMATDSTTITVKLK
jgi:hypothetical protein